MRRPIRRALDLAAPIADVVKAVSTPIPAPREFFVWHGVKIERRFAQRPRVHHVEVSRAKSQGRELGL